MKREDGFSLIELLTAMTVAAIAVALAFAFHRDFGKAMRMALGRQGQGMSEAAWTASLQRGLLEGNGLTEVWPGGLAFENRVGKELRLEKRQVDSSVDWNGKALPWTFAKFEINAYGPDCGDPPFDDDPECRTLLDSLNWNGDRFITLDELDRNRDGKVSGREIRYVRLLEIVWKEAGTAPERRMVVHPRTRKTAGISGSELL